MPKAFDLQRHCRAVEFRVEPRHQVIVVQTLTFPSFKMFEYYIARGIASLEMF